MAIKLLIVDDSTLFRQILAGIFAEEPEIEIVGTARNGQEALLQIASLKPDVITMDIEMPVMDGLDCLAKIMADNPLPVIMVSSYSIAGAEPTIKAFELGAVDFVTKISTTEPEMIINAAELIMKVKIAATIDISKLKYATPTTKPADAVKFHKLTSLEMLVIGTSTGGPKALHHLLPQFPSNFPLGILVGQHMPVDFTKIFSKRLDTYCELEVAEAKSGDQIKPGKILIAPSGKQTIVVRDKEALVVEVSDKPVLIYKPSLDHLFKSLASSCQGKLLAVILTGMGSDGAAGMKELRDLGARTIAESQESCVVFGMPRVAIQLGGVEFTESLFNVYQRIASILEESA